MIKRLKKKLMFLFTLFIILFLTCMTIIYLSISYNALYDRSALTFQQNSLSIYTTISNNHVLDNAYFNTYTANNYEIYISDYQNLITLESDHPFSNPDAVFSDVIALSATEEPINTNIFEYKIFTYKALNGKKYFASVSNSVQNNVMIVILNSQESLHRQFLSIITKYIIISSVCIVILCIFAFVFISRLLEPVEKSTEQQKQFIAAASHELRTPLTLIKSSLLAMKPKEDTPICKYYEIANSECTRMSELLNDLLTLSRIDGNRWTLQMQNQHIEPVLFQCYNNFEELVRKKKLNFIIDLPNTPISCYTFDRNKIIQLLTILIDNACQYTDEGSITLQAYEKKNHLYLLVQDTGIGIAKDYTEKVFERFFQVNQSHSNPNHFGLGLSIAKEIVTLHNGEIAITETPGGGTTIVVKI